MEKNAIKFNFFKKYCPKQKYFTKINSFLEEKSEKREE